MRLLNPYFLLLAAVLMVMALLFKSHAQPSTWQQIIASEVRDFLGFRVQRIAAWPLRMIVAVLVAVALSTPAIRLPEDKTLQHSNGWVVLADLSRSMSINDVLPSRLAAMRVTLNAVSTAAEARPLALIVYAGDAFLAVPPAFDRTLFNEQSALLEYGIIPVDGSNLARALALASSVITESHYLHARVLVLSDSGGMGASSDAAARHMAQQGHQVDVILFGESTANNEQSVDEAAAKSLVNAGNGQLLRANLLGEVDLQKLSISAADETTHNAAMRALHWKNQSHWLLLLLLPMVLLLFRRTPSC